jgi:hypothetical protein
MLWCTKRVLLCYVTHKRLPLADGQQACLCTTRLPSGLFLITLCQPLHSAGIQQGAC